MAISNLSFRETLVKSSGQTGELDFSDTSLINMTSTTVVGAGMDRLSNTTYTTASTISVNNIFTSSYQNYRLVIRGVTSAQTAIIRIRARIAGVDTTTSVYSYGIGYVQNGGMARLTGASSDTGADVAWGGNQFFSSSIDILGPNLVTPTVYQGTGFCRYDAVSTALMIAGSHHTAVAMDGLTLYPISGTFTGNIRIYGYRD